MPLLSVLTVAQASRADLLAEAAESLAGQELPAGWEFEWILQEDGDTPELAELARRFPFARHAAWGKLGQLGLSATRNLALSRACGELVGTLDSDDVLLPGALAVAIEAFAAYPDIHWVSAQADDLTPDGQRVPFEPYLRPGYVEIGAVRAFVEANDLMPVACPGVTMRTATVRALGGWAANPRWDDSALFVALAEIAPGYVTPEVTWLYRQHEDQNTKQPSWTALRAEFWISLRQRIDALRELGLRVPATATR
ncbi:MAG TPA: glycosyltransferase [Pseudonocardiaceae bacterium]|jgi:glycosyltransferase involved in cell wall biosynthesis|nr:glycosyltransferase [Pseudonocardiaceae bacterium]